MVQHLEFPARSRRRVRHRKTLANAVAATFVAAACSGDDDDASDTTAAATDDSPATAEGVLVALTSQRSTFGLDVSGTGGSADEQ